MDKVIVCLSGGDVVHVVTPDDTDVEVEVRQYHRDFKAFNGQAGEIMDDELLPGCRYEVVEPC